MIDSRSVNFSQNAWYDACSAEVEQCINNICYRNACGGAGAAVLSGDGRHAARMAGAAGRYVALLQRYANNRSDSFPELLNITSAGDRYVSPA